VWLKSQLEDAYRMLDDVDRLRAQEHAQGDVTLEDRIAWASVRQDVEAVIALILRRLRSLARSGGCGVTVDIRR